MSRGSVKPRLNAEGVVTSYRVVYELAPDPATGKRRQKTESAPNKKAAQKLLTQRLAELDGGTYAAASKQTVEQFFEQWLTLRSVRWRETTRLTYAATLRRYVYPAFGSTRLQVLRPEQVEAFVAGMAARYARATVSVALMVLRYGIKDAMAWGVLVKDPTRTVRADGRAPREMRLWTPEQAGRFLRGYAGEHAVLIRLLLDGGMRIGEVLPLRWSDIDLGQAELRVDRTISTSHPHLGEGPPKTKAGRRTITLGRETVAALKLHRREQTARRLAHPAWVDEDRVFDRGDGGLLPSRYVRTAFEQGCAALGLPVLNLHGLRHTSATAGLAAGVDAVTMKERLGHKTLEMTLGVYAHVLEEQRRAAADSIESAYADAKKVFAAASEGAFSGVRDQSVSEGEGEQANLA